MEAMLWTPVQRDRLAIEKSTLEKYFYDRITWIDPIIADKTKVEVQFTSNSNKDYKLRIYVPSDFPNSCPKLVIVSPKNLLRRNGELIPSRSNQYHTLERRDGFQSICHFYPPDWTADNTLYQVFMKGRLWIEAYEAHLETGENLDVFLGHQKFTYNPENPWVPDQDEEDLHGRRPRVRVLPGNRPAETPERRQVRHRSSDRPSRSHRSNAQSEPSLSRPQTSGSEAAVRRTRHLLQGQQHSPRVLTDDATPPFRAPNRRLFHPMMDDEFDDY